MKDAIVKRIFYRIDFELVTPFALSERSFAHYNIYDENFAPFIQSHSIASAFNNYIPSPNKNCVNDIYIYDAPFYSYKIKSINRGNKKIIGVDKGALGSIYLQVTVHKKNIINDNGKVYYVNAAKGEVILNSYLINIIKGIRTGAITLGGCKRLKFGQLRITEIHEKIFDKYNASEYLNFHREEWVR